MWTGSCPRTQLTQSNTDYKPFCLAAHSCFSSACAVIIWNHPEIYDLVYRSVSHFVRLKCFIFLSEATLTTQIKTCSLGLRLEIPLTFSTCFGFKRWPGNKQTNNFKGFKMSCQGIKTPKVTQSHKIRTSIHISAIYSDICWNCGVPLLQKSFSQADVVIKHAKCHKFLLFKLYQYKM